MNSWKRSGRDTVGSRSTTLNHIEQPHLIYEGGCDRMCFRLWWSGGAIRPLQKAWRRSEERPWTWLAMWRPQKMVCMHIHTHPLLRGFKGSSNKCVPPFNPERLPFRGRCLKEAGGWHHQRVQQLADRSPGAPGETRQDSYNLSHHFKLILIDDKINQFIFRC